MRLENEQPNFGAGCWEYRDYLSLKDVLCALKAASVVLCHTLKKKGKCMKATAVLLWALGLRQKGASWGDLPGVLTKRSETVSAGFCAPSFSFVCKNCSDFHVGRQGQRRLELQWEELLGPCILCLGNVMGTAAVQSQELFTSGRSWRSSCSFLCCFFPFFLFLFVKPEMSRSHQDHTSLGLLAAWMGCFQRFPTCPLLLSNTPQSVCIPFVMQEQKEIWYTAPVLK